MKDQTGSISGYANIEDSHTNEHTSVCCCCCSVVSDSLQPHGLQHARLPCPSICSLFKLMSVESVMPSSHLILCCPLLLLPSIFPRTQVTEHLSRCQLWTEYPVKLDSSHSDHHIRWSNRKNTHKKILK